MENWEVTLLVIVIAVVVTSFFIWFFSSIIEAIIDYKIFKKSVSEFEKDLFASLKHSQPKWTALKEIAATRGLSQSQIQPTLKNTLRDIYAGRLPELEGYSELVAGYITDYRKDEPFEGLPSDIRLHMQRVREKLSEPLLLEPLTTHIKEMGSVHTKENQRLKFYTVGGFFVGVLGVILAVVFYFATPSQAELVKVHSEAATSVGK
ncbi:hypothetical protein [Vibrio viridaestus]|uniref:Uncharacterized protein n=1 Tax=Vibrio viridaestus TaxID=2487322 RepID=A0A3N9TAH1_9VIBR|nr:hypothetical protein [Vibrio viridaestus]RQW61111.1 hypothetical protein EES38_21200 [Vibrio viridaestus]